MMTGAESTSQGAASRPPADRPAARRHGARVTLFGMLIGLACAMPLAWKWPWRPWNNLIDRLEGYAYDGRMTLRNRFFPKPICATVKFVGITELDHDLLGPAIDDREAHVYLLEALERLGVSAALFDIIFEYPRPNDPLLAFRMQEVPSYLAYKFRAESASSAAEATTDSARPSTGSLVSMTATPTVEPPPEREALRGEIEALGERIEELAARQRSFDIDFDARNQLAREQRELEQRRAERCADWLLIHHALPLAAETGGGERAPVAMRLNLPLPSFLLSARGLGFVNAKRLRPAGESDESVLRRIPLIYRYKGQLYPNLDLAVLMDHYGVGPADVRVHHGQAIEFEPRRNGAGPKRIPIDEEGSLLVNYREAENFLRRSTGITPLIAYRLGGDHAPAGFDPESWRGAIVVVGEASAGGVDIEPVPVQARFPLSALHANVLHSILVDDYLIPMPPTATRLLILAMGLLAGLGLPRMLLRRERWAYAKTILLALAMVVLFIAASMAAFVAANKVTPFVRPLGALVGAFLMNLVYVYITVDREQRLSRRILNGLVSPEIAEEILSDFDALGSEKRAVTVLFVDVRGFTPLAERRTPEEVVRILSAFYDAVTPIVFAHHGQVNKFIGDAVMALFGAPRSIEHEQLNAVLAAVEIQDAVQRLNYTHELLRGDGQPGSEGETLRVGIGVNTDDVIVGVTGDRSTRFEYTALGDGVNVAERICGVTPPGEIYLGGATMRGALAENADELRRLGLHFDELEPVSVKGKSEPVPVFRVSREAAALVHGAPAPPR